MTVWVSAAVCSILKTLLVTVARTAVETVAREGYVSGREMEGATAAVGCRVPVQVPTQNPPQVTTVLLLSVDS